jgi:hypothetical protein
MEWTIAFRPTTECHFFQTTVLKHFIRGCVTGRGPWRSERSVHSGAGVFLLQQLGGSAVRDAPSVPSSTRTRSGRRETLTLLVLSHGVDRPDDLCGFTGPPACGAASARDDGRSRNAGAHRCHRARPVLAANNPDGKLFRDTRERWAVGRNGWSDYNPLRLPKSARCVLVPNFGAADMRGTSRRFSQLRFWRRERLLFFTSSLRMAQKWFRRWTRSRCF